MELNKYVGKVCKVELSNGYYYVGTVEAADENSIFLIDKNGDGVTIKDSYILFIKEVSR